LISPRPGARSASWTEASVWADVLVRYRLLHAALPTPSGQWRVQQRPHGPVEILSGPSAVLDLAARLQQRTRSGRTRSR
jgi:hypothetical protein